MALAWTLTTKNTHFQVYLEFFWFKLNMWKLAGMFLARVPEAYSLTRPIKPLISNIRHNGTLWIGNFMLMLKKISNLSLCIPLTLGHDQATVPKFQYDGTLLNFIIWALLITKFLINRVPLYSNFGTAAGSWP
jgi:hypothetical protein